MCIVVLFTGELVVVYVSTFVCSFQRSFSNARLDIKCCCCDSTISIVVLFVFYVFFDNAGCVYLSVLFN